MVDNVADKHKPADKLPDLNYPARARTANAGEHFRDKDKIYAMC